MSNQISNISKVEDSHSVTLLTFSSDKAFEAVISDFEKQLGRFDEDEVLASGANLQATVEAMAGSSGLMIIHVLQMGRILPALSSSDKAVQYNIGNPLIASKMAQHDVLVALYAPPRILIYVADDKTCISYDQPSDTFGRLSSREIDATAKDLDEKIERLVTNALS